VGWMGGLMSFGLLAVLQHLNVVPKGFYTKTVRLTNSICKQALLVSRLAGIGSSSSSIYFVLRLQNQD